MRCRQPNLEGTGEIEVRQEESRDLVIAFNVFGPNPISELLQDAIALLPQIIVAIVIIVVAAAIAKVVKDLVSSVLGGLSCGKTLANIASIFILFLGVVAALDRQALHIS